MSYLLVLQSKGLINERRERRGGTSRYLNKLAALFPRLTNGRCDSAPCGVLYSLTAAERREGRASVFGVEVWACLLELNLT